MRDFLSGLLTALVLLVTQFGVLAVAAPPDLESAAVRESIESLAAPYIESNHVDGMSIGLIAGGKTKTFHFGKVSAAGDEPNDQTVYEIGSVSKVFTGVMLADAVVNSKVTLPQDAQTLLPEGATMPSFEGKRISLLDLSTHRSGLPRLPDNMKNQGSDNPYADYSSETAIEFLTTHQLRRAPGTEMEYSNFAVSLLGHLLCRKSGQSYDDLLLAEIAKPLKMDNTTVTSNQSILERLATGHSIPGTAVSTWEFSDLPGAGGIRSTVADMLKFAQANLDPPKSKLGDALELAWKEHRAAEGEGFAMGLGWHIARDRQTRWHNGQTGGFHSMIFVNRQIPAAVVLLANTATMEVDPLAEKLLTMMAGADVKPREFQTKATVPIDKMEALEGRYQFAPGVVFEVNVVEQRLMVQLSGQPAFEVFPKSETQWFYKVVEATLTFNKASDGSTVSLELSQNGIRQTAKRIEP